MAELLKRAILRPQAEDNPTLDAIRDIYQRMTAIESQFSLQEDHDLIEACIFEMKALRAQYRFLLRRAKDEGITATFAAPLWED